jgi:hypothetical protein
VIGKAATRPDVSSGLAGSSRNHRSHSGTCTPPTQPVGSAELMVWATTGAAQLAKFEFLFLLLPTEATQQDGDMRCEVLPAPLVTRAAAGLAHGRDGDSGTAAAFGSNANNAMHYSHPRARERVRMAAWARQDGPLWRRRPSLRHQPHCRWNGAFT